ncbi:ArsR family transcriptional regulator [Cronobacter sakazakii]|uniref:ArsR/SmtB family transcription factor n=1 Tax=Cronobacter sakazakii TaxID=28141 RepID=UPI00084E2827|nr:metalloregulator ArsR/SmtB family transcription factor [Cronobacter sakazakii]EJG0601596.1 winged helix-turn-helix transcriptional regulator [Cronobacter sakazakii]EJG0605136.1 winged helix-turn-helix transcriptional regulator [Cronobacter sakazakii]EJG0609711.1 winged helix-turn-helix transcriptional regulator [Cronobacter sakazakii]EJG0614235.1 winged helix-turn-helix transcriptional regulator [Cronobacter sakazakii]EJG0623395.1 winged helix-turn-helix transcriptional regulator [Cronobact
MTDLNALHRQAASAAALLKTLSHPQRLLILCVLIENPGTEAGELCKMSGLSPSATSQHLARMKAEGLIEGKREARYIRYHIKNEAVVALVHTLKTIYCPGE